ncbi:hydrogenase maturation nickel metallochaperone HypA [Paludibacterium yongneupense]|uniref:hydrogenase maturation nickel metallochaperone HypA n=1 Tax=Paludibacterium yongneupense TaxID=400061 RepID=UPI0004920ABB|nr:hydrogenase maturation nickel metallochaperone HypA [Paludibacterium yongneupense]
MHELTLAESVLEIVGAAARRAGASRVTGVRLAIGALAHVESDTLQYCCEVASRDTIAADARFSIERPPGRAWCAACAAEVGLERWGMPCPQCQGFDLSITDGDQMRVLDIDIA